MQELQEENFDNPAFSAKGDLYSFLRPRYLRHILNDAKRFLVKRGRNEVIHAIM